MALPLHAPLDISFDYTRSLGPTLSRFMTGLAQRRIIGSRDSTGRVHAPPIEYDPVTHAQSTDFVEVAATGTVLTWTWMARPIEGQPLAHPFAWALIRLDGADTPMLHAVDAGSAGTMSTGMRVQVRWAAETIGSIRDIACFEPLSTSEACRRGATGGTGHDGDDAYPVELRTHGLAGRDALSLRAGRGTGFGPALPRVPQGLHSAAWGLPDLWRAHHR